MSSTRQSTGRSRRSDNNERESQEGNDNNSSRVNRHQGHHSRGHRKQFYSTFQTEGFNNVAHNSPRPTVPETVPSVCPAILRPAIMRHSVTGLRIPRVGSIPTTILEMRTSTHSSRSSIPQVMSPVPENQIHEIRSSGINNPGTTYSSNNCC